MLIVRVAIALGLAVLLLVGAWSDSHGESSTGSALCLASGASATSVSDQQQAASPDSAAPDAGLLGVCAMVVFLLMIIALRLPGDHGAIRHGRSAAATAPPRAGPAAFLPTLALTLTQLSISRT